MTSEAAKSRSDVVGQLSLPTSCCVVLPSFRYWRRRPAWLRAGALNVRIFSLSDGAVSLSEAKTEDEIVKPILNARVLPMHGCRRSILAKGREDVPDYLLFADSTS